MTNVSDLFPAGGGNNTIEMVASGALANGDKVILKTDGTVEVVAETSTSAITGSPILIQSASAHYASVVFYSRNTIVIAYSDGGNSSYATAIVGVISGATITFGTPVAFDTAAGVSSNFDTVYDANADKIVIVYKDGNWNHAKAIVGTVSGNSISFGTTVQFDGNLYTPSITFDSSNNKIVIFYTDVGNSYYGTAIVGTVSGTSISFGTKVAFTSYYARQMSSVFDSSNNKIVTAFMDAANNDYGRAIVATVSGTTMSFGSIATFYSNSTDWIGSAYDSANNKIVVAFKSEWNTYWGKCVVGTVSGTSISFGSAITFNGNKTEGKGIVYNPDEGHISIAYRDYGNSSYGTHKIGTVSGTTMSFGSPSVFESAGIANPASAYYSPHRVTAYADDGNSSYGTLVIDQYAVSIPNLTSTNLLGIAKGAAADTETVKVETLGGLATNLSGLTIGSKYYVQDDGTITTSSAGTNQFLGRAITATTINMKDFT